MRYILRMSLPQVQPLIPIASKDPFDDPNWLFEFKYDGFRALCYIEQGRCRFISRNANILSRFDALCEQVATELNVDEAILDGEVIATDETGRPQFYDLLRRAGRPSYVPIFCGSTVPTSVLCPSASAGGSCKLSCPNDPRSFRRRWRFKAEDGRFSTYASPRPRGDCCQAPRRSVRAPHQMAQDQEPRLLAARRERRAVQHPQIVAPMRWRPHTSASCQRKELINACDPA